MITTEQLQQLAKVLRPKRNTLWNERLWVKAAEAQAKNNPPVIADQAALNMAFGIGEMK